MAVNRIKRGVSDPMHSPHEAAAPLDVAQFVDAVLDLVSGTRVADIEVEWQGASVRVKREPSTPSWVSIENSSTATDDESVTVTSVYVGVFHGDEVAANGSAGTSFPQIGDHVSAGQPLAYIDTLRIQNPVVAPVDGTILDVLVADGTPVEYGQPVLVIRPDAPDQ
jgi:acetyl-CoA carboxylase biotin carboxyl carrier protein